MSMKRTIAHLPWTEGGPRSTRRLALLCHLARLIWQLARRIRWAELTPHDYARLEAVLPMLERTASKALAATRLRRRKGAI